MNIRIMICLAIILTGLSAATLAAPRWEVDQTKLPPGLTKEKAVAMLEEIDRKTAKELADEEAAQRRKAERVQRTAKKYEERLARAVNKDPELRALRDKIEAGAEALENPKLSEEERNTRLERMMPDLKALRTRGLTKAGVDARAMNNEIRRALSDGITPRGEDAGAGVEYVLDEDGGFFYVKSDYDKLSPSSNKVTTRGTTTRILKEPWPYGEEETNIGSISGGTDKQAGEYHAYAAAVGVGAGTNRRGLAHYLTVPSGITRIRVTAQLPETKYSNRAYAFVFGAGAQTKTYSKIEVWDGSSRRLCRSSKLHNDLWFVIVGGASKQGSHNIVLECEFDAPAAGRDIVVMFVSDIFVQAWGLAIAYGIVYGTPADVRIELISPTTTIKKLYYR
jgi:hypothetical protein